MAKRSNDGDKGRGKSDAKGVVIKLGIGLGDKPPESLTIKVRAMEGREVFDHVDQLLEAVANDPTLPPDDGQDDDDGRRLRSDPSAN